ncbi:hypothetical protein [Rickettsiella massiliensis]|uniref:hypothetical protein n=1 Tax=Rickettsiella massiliensis TaxID=676517 RepID=UPI0012EAC462|nr:hypothetical protein [Rickettsiella massiliensis]
MNTPKKKDKEPNYFKLNQNETNVITKAPNKTVSKDEIEVLSSEIVDLPLVENKYPNCLARFSNWMCFWNNPEEKPIDPSAVYQPTTIVKQPR